jgi:hypothetical protein
LLQTLQENEDFVGELLEVRQAQKALEAVPVAPITQMVLYIDGTKLAPIKDGSAILRQRVGMLRLQADDLIGSLAPLCDIVVTKNRITTVMVSILERPPRCQCRFSGTNSRTMAGHTCLS